MGVGEFWMKMSIFHEGFMWLTYTHFLGTLRPSGTRSSVPQPDFRGGWPFGGREPTDRPGRERLVTATTQRHALGASTVHTHGQPFLTAGMFFIFRS
ncbi:MAG: hypothetical protein RJB39_206 [Candidatus Parcubacteria bacterium]|jgi:hypothetical protein